MYTGLPLNRGSQGVQERSGGNERIFRNQGRLGNFQVSNCFILERRLSPCSAMHPVERDCSQLLLFCISICSMQSFSSAVPFCYEAKNLNGEK